MYPDVSHIEADGVDEKSTMDSCVDVIYQS